MLGSSKRIFQFGVFEMDTESGELRKSGTKLKLGEQPARILVHMLERPGTVITREELRDLLWGQETFVDFEHGLSAAINKLREVLGDSAANPEFIETIPRRGYRFLAEVIAASASLESKTRSEISGNQETSSAAKNRPAIRLRAHLLVKPPTKILAGAGLLIICVLVFLWYLLDRQAVPLHDSIRFEIALPGTMNCPPFRVSPNGRNVVIGANRLWVRALDSFEARPLPGTDGAYDPFWSPDSKMIGFFARGKLKKISLLGGLPQTLCDARAARGGTWSREGVIVFASDGVRSLLRVPVAGGVPVPATRVAADGSEQHRYPEFLPDGRHFLFLDLNAKPELSGVYAGSLDTAALVPIMDELSNALYAPDMFTHRTGHLLFRQGSTLLAQRFDPDRLRRIGEPLPIAEEVGISGSRMGSFGFGAFSVSENGALAYQTGSGAGSNQFVWVDRTGKREHVVAKHGAGIFPAMSPDGTRTVFSRENLDGSEDLWLQNLDDGDVSRFTSGPGTNVAGPWSPDGHRIAFYRFAGGQFALYQKPTNGAGSEELLTRLAAPALTWDWSNNGSLLVFSEFSGTTRCDLWLLPLKGDRKPYPYLKTVANESSARFSPDGHWMAYVSDESGRPEVWVQSIPRTGAKWQISTGGGFQPRWRQDGRELFYVSAEQNLMAVPVRLGLTFEAGVPRSLSNIRGSSLYWPAANGSRFLLSEAVAGEKPRISFVLNWQAALKR